MDRQSEALGSGNKHAAARGPVELGHDKAGDLRHVAEYLDLVERILAGRGVKNEYDVVRRRGVEAPQDAPDLGQLIQQLALVLEPPRGIVDNRR
jgi:hypothetical protein